jgi:hypothetical protein
VNDVRLASIGFSIWESKAPRYTAHKLIANGKLVEPSFAFAGETGARGVSDVPVAARLS